MTVYKCSKLGTMAKYYLKIFRSSTECSGHCIVVLLIFGGNFFMEKYQKINSLRIDTEVSEIELRKNWFFQKFKCKISFYNIWEPKMSQLIVIGSHWGFAGCSLVSQWGSLRVIWWSFGGHSGKLNFEFGNKFDYLICHSVLTNFDIAPWIDFKKMCSKL